MRLSGTDALSLYTQSSKAPAHTVSLVIIDASDQLATSGYTNWWPRRCRRWRASAADW